MSSRDFWFCMKKTDLEIDGLYLSCIGFVMREWDLTWDDLIIQDGWVEVRTTVDKMRAYGFFLRIGQLREGINNRIMV